MNKNLLLLLFIGAFVFVKAQTVTYTINSGPAFKAFPHSRYWTGANWDSLSYNDTAWSYAHNGSGTDSNGFCEGANTSLYQNGDTLIWTKVYSVSPDTGCLRKIVNLGNCGHVTAANFSIVADDTFVAYLNGSEIANSPGQSNTAAFYLSPTGLALFTTWDNIFAFEVINSSPNCGKFDMTGAITVDTTGCYLHVGVNNIKSEDVIISPNPTKQYVNVTMPDESQIYNLKVIDVIGNIVSERMSVQKTVSIDLGNLANGVYILQLDDRSGKQLTRRIVKE